MKFSCENSLLNEAISNVSLAVSAKSTIPALEGILMKCENNVLTLTGYNMELGIIKSIPVKSEQNGEIILNASLLSNIVSKMPSGTISVSSDEKNLTVIRCNDAEFTILGMDCDDYPEIPSINEDKKITLSCDIFKSFISQTLFAVAQIDTIPVYTGTLFDIENKMLSVVSVDGYRLAMRKEPVDINEDIKFVVPGKTLNEIQKLLAKFNDEEDNQISIKASNKHIIFEIYGYSIISRLLEGEFLDYKTAVPKQYSTRITVNTKDFINSINRASIIINDRAKSPIKCEFEKGLAKLKCETTLGKVQDEFNIETDGSDVLIGFNNKYMLDALKASESDKVIIELNGPLSPMKVLPLEGDSFLFLVLPVRLKDN